MIKLKELLINEYISNDLISLKKYFLRPLLELKEEIVKENPYLVKLFAKDYFDIASRNFILQNKKSDIEIIKEFKQKFPAEFIDFLDWADGELYNNKRTVRVIPTCFAMRYEKVIKNQWLIHFTDWADKIWEEQTFKYGISDFNKLSYSSNYSNDLKPVSGGFNFAYDIIDYVKYGHSSYREGRWKYGSEAVLFKASGIKAHHLGDNEPQVIFSGNTAKDIVWLHQMDKEWMVTNPKKRKIIYRAQTLPEVVNWVINNFNQYKHVLLP